MGYQYIFMTLPRTPMYGLTYCHNGNALPSVCAMMRLQPPTSPALDYNFVCPTVCETRTAQTRAKPNIWKDQATLDEQDIYRTHTEYICIPPDEDELCLRLCVVAHYGGGEHRGIDATLTATKKAFGWPGTTSDVKKPNDLINIDLVHMKPAIESLRDNMGSSSKMTRRSMYGCPPRNQPSRWLRWMDCSRGLQLLASAGIGCRIKVPISSVFLWPNSNAHWAPSIILPLHIVLGLMDPSARDVGLNEMQPGFIERNTFAAT
uniref:AlNc14C323G10612 protein n=1 Tax=Albugo laibachii Nc14 TaxID=890382 RepID=F0WWK1_9STRA|nr:AlNc14C323G10612 [Albugo laibachii Nc14]|eukprot:CCA25824.1 AlNc14C323G10612 [Albugo laibachii Nc14]